MPPLRLQTPKPKSQDAKAPKQQPQSPELQDPKAPASQHPTAPKLCVQTKSAILEEIVDPARRKTKISGHLLSFTLAYYAFLGCVPKVFDFPRSYTAGEGSFRARCWESIWVSTQGSCQLERPLRMAGQGVHLGAIRILECQKC